MTALGYASAVAVVTAVLAALTLLPAVLALVGQHIESARLPTACGPAEGRGPRVLGRLGARSDHTSRGAAILGVLALLIPLIVPFLSLNLGQEDIGATPKTTTERQAYDLMAAGFGVGYNGPLLVAVELGTPAKPTSEYTKQNEQAQSAEEAARAGAEAGEVRAAAAAGAGELAQRAEQAAEGAADSSSSSSRGALEAQQADLERQAKADTQEQAQLQASANKLEAEQVALNKQIAATAGQAKKVVRDGAKTTKQLTSALQPTDEAPGRAAEGRGARSSARRTRAARRSSRPRLRQRCRSRRRTSRSSSRSSSRQNRRPARHPRPCSLTAQGAAQAGGQRREPRASRSPGSPRRSRRMPSRLVQQKQSLASKRPTCRARRRSSRPRRRTSRRRRRS